MTPKISKLLNNSVFSTALIIFYLVFTPSIAFSLSAETPLEALDGEVKITVNECLDDGTTQKALQYNTTNKAFTCEPLEIPAGTVTDVSASTNRGLTQTNDSTTTPKLGLQNCPVNAGEPVGEILVTTNTAGTEWGCHTPLALGSAGDEAMPGSTTTITGTQATKITQSDDRRPTAFMVSQTKISTDSNKNVFMGLNGSISSSADDVNIPVRAATFRNLRCKLSGAIASGAGIIPSMGAGACNSFSPSYGLTTTSLDGQAVKTSTNSSTTTAGQCVVMKLAITGATGSASVFVSCSVEQNYDETP